MSWYISDSPRRYSWRQNVSFEPSRVFVRRSASLVRDSEKCEKNINRKSQSLCISGRRGGAPIQPPAMGVCAFVKVPNIIKRANLGDIISRGLRGLVSAKGQFQAFEGFSRHDP
jgi:hypothetical protein